MGDIQERSDLPDAELLFYKEIQNLTEPRINLTRPSSPPFIGTRGTYGGASKDKTICLLTGMLLVARSAYNFRFHFLSCFAPP